MALVSGFDRKHPRGVVATRLIVAVWLLVLSGILAGHRMWWWMLLTLTGAVLHIVLAYRVHRATKH